MAIIIWLFACSLNDLPCIAITFSLTWCTLLKLTIIASGPIDSSLISYSFCSHHHFHMITPPLTKNPNSWEPTMTPQSPIILICDMFIQTPKISTFWHTKKSPMATQYKKVYNHTHPIQNYLYKKYNWGQNYNNQHIIPSIGS